MPDSDKVTMVLDFLAEDDARSAVGAIEKRLWKSKLVKECTAMEPTVRTVSTGDILAVVGAAIVLVKSGRMVLEELKDLILEIQAFVGKLHGIKKALIKVGEETVDLLNVTDKTLDAKLQKKGKS